MQRLILIVDDSDINRRILKKVLGDEYAILEAANGEEALEILLRDHERISVVLLDIVMPVMDGYEALRRMRSNRQLSGVPVIVTTGSGEVDAEVKALSLGANDFLVKPYNAAVIRHRIWNTINFRETAAVANAAKWDELTGLYNRKAFFEKASELISRREAGYYVLSSMDIDNFKVINDQYGSEKGDEVLKHLADTFRVGFGAVGGICARIAADNFAVLYPRYFMDSDEIEDMRRLAVSPGGPILPMTISTGRYIVNDKSLEVRAMYDRACIAEAAIKGRFDRHVAQYDESMREHILREQDIVNEMNGALMSRQFEAWLQPQFNHASGALIGAEALVRWRHPQKGLVSPGDFIPVFERNGFIYELDKYVWEQTCALLRKWLDEGRSPLPLSVNISRYDIFRDDFFEALTGLIEKYAIPVELLRLEITESAFAKSSAQIIGVVKRLLDYGFIIEIDDFGSGYSSLNTLKDVRANILKLDMRFLETSGDSGRGGNILESIVRMARWLGMPVIAEGVETVAQADYLKSIGCYYVQGYLYARPMPIGEFESFMATGKIEKKLDELRIAANVRGDEFWSPSSLDTLIFNNYIGAACVFEYVDGRTELLRVNDKYARELGGDGMSAEEAMSIRLADYMDDNNLDIMRINNRRAVESGEEVSYEVCLRELGGARGDSHILAVVRPIARSGNRYLLYCTVSNVTALREAERGERAALDKLRAATKSAGGEAEFRDMLPVALAAMMESSTDLSFVKDRNLVYICSSRAFARMLGLESEREIVGKTDYDLFDAALAEKYRSDDFKLMDGGKSLVDYVEYLPSEDGVARYSRTSKYLLHDAAGDVIGIYGIGRDITENRTADERLKLFIDSPACGIAMLEISPGTLRTLYFSEGFYNFSGYTRAEYEALTKERPTYFVFDEDIGAVNEALEALRSENAPLDLLFRCHTRAGGYRWFNIRGAVTERRGDTAIVNIVQFDVSDLKAAEESIRVHEEEMKLAMSQMGRMICEYDIAGHTLTMPSSYASQYGLPLEVANVPESIYAMNVVHPDSRASFEAFYAAIFAGESSRVADFRVLRADGEYHWERTEFSTIFGSGGKPLKAIIAIEDTTRQHIKYELEQNRPTMGEGNLLVHALFNLTTGETLEYAYKDGGEVPHAERTAFTNGCERLDALIDEEERRRFRALNDTEALLERYRRGETECSLDYRRRVAGGDVIWVRNILHLLRDPGGEDVLLFEYCYNIEEEKTRELVYHSLAADNYDYVAQIDGRTGKFITIAGARSEGGVLPSCGADSDEVAEALVESNVLPEDREAVNRNASLEGIRANLASVDRFQFTCRMALADGSVCHKRFTEYYLDRERQIIVFAREDITALIREETRKNKMLADALEAANQASRAKSQFLSRMSHELRTPMNAIIGLSTLAAGDLGNPRAMEDAISKIGMSARYLLSLINDILEMSRIESGRATLNESPFDFESFISSINTIIYGQASAKGVDYDAVVNGRMEPGYMGDATKLQQILVNVLGNAVKFTPRGGKIVMAMEQLRRADKLATLRFVISDTGVGIEKEFLPHLFDAFSQESASFTSTSTGTGLGLAITKSLVSMMNGQISVRSIKNVGSVFTIDVQLGILEDSQRYSKMNASINLDRLKTLVVDDDVVVCRSTESMLSEMGIRAEWVDSGQVALERVAAACAAKDDFNAIFIDWKMPDMDGIETARRIRGVVGRDVTIIIMTAYDWRDIQERALEAGVDMFMEKPLFQASIVRAFEKAFSANGEKPEEKPAIKPDLAGRRILLVEDHPLNVEVAKRLLQRAGAEVHVAGNGLEALEIFTTSDDNYFDAILMDIRMPVMDGLTATRNIRNLKKASSRVIPIIAMTANAFDEDVELSLSSGMDAHLTKPIDPSALFATLQRLMN